MHSYIREIKSKSMKIKITFDEESITRCPPNLVPMYCLVKSKVSTQTPPQGHFPPSMSNASSVASFHLVVTGHVSLRTVHAWPPLLPWPASAPAVSFVPIASALSGSV